MCFGKLEKVDPEVRFWCNVRSSKDGCWEWVGYIGINGYGFTSVKCKRWLAHRLSWSFHFGDPGSLEVCHKCDNPKCVRPDHLFLGTHADNMRDMSIKFRGSRTVSTEKAIQVIADYKAEPFGTGGRKRMGFLDEMVLKFGISKQTILAIVRGNKAYLTGVEL